MNAIKLYFIVKYSKKYKKKENSFCQFYNVCCKINKKKKKEI